MLRAKIGTAPGIDVDGILTKDGLKEAMTAFTQAIKQQFNPLAGECDSEYPIPILRAPDLPFIGLEAGYLTLSQYLPF